MTRGKRGTGTDYVTSSVALLPQQWEDLRALSRLRDQSVSAITRQAIEEFMAREKARAAAPVEPLPEPERVAAAV